MAGGYSSVVEHSTADREVPGSNPGVPYRFLFNSIQFGIAIEPFTFILSYTFLR